MGVSCSPPIARVPQLSVINLVDVASTLTKKWSTRVYKPQGYYYTDITFIRVMLIKYYQNK